jgi:hypothetical protein
LQSTLDFPTKPEIVVARADCVAVSAEVEMAFEVVDRIVARLEGLAAVVVVWTVAANLNVVLVAAVDETGHPVVIFSIVVVTFVVPTAVDLLVVLVVVVLACVTAGRVAATSEVLLVALVVVDCVVELGGVVRAFAAVVVANFVVVVADWPVGSGSPHCLTAAKHTSKDFMTGYTFCWYAVLSP